MSDTADPTGGGGGDVVAAKTNVHDPVADPTTGDTAEAAPSPAPKANRTNLHLGGQGTGQQEFNNPGSIALNPARDRLLVVDNGNHRIKVYEVDPDDPTAYRPDFMYAFGSHKPSYKLKGRQVFFTGKFQGTKNDYEERAAKIGASIDKAADSGTNVMVAGQGVTEGQLKEAKRMGIEVWEESDYMAAAEDDEAEANDEDEWREGRGGRGGSAPGELRYPGKVVVDSNNRAFVCDSGNARLQVFRLGATEAVFERQVTHVQDSSQLARSGSESKDGEAKVASTSQTEVEGEQFGDAGLSVALSVDEATLYVSDLKNNRIHALDSTSFVKIASVGRRPGDAPAAVVASDGSDGSGDAAGHSTPAHKNKKTPKPRGKVKQPTSHQLPAGEFNSPIAMAPSCDGSCLFVAEWGSHRIQKLQANDLQPLAAVGSRGLLMGELQYPCDLVTADVGQGSGSAESSTVFVLENANHRIQRFVAREGSRNRAKCCALGHFGTGSPDTGPPEFCHPRGMAINFEADCVFVGDSQNHRIVLVTGLCEQMDAANTKKKKKKNGIGT